MTLIVETGDEQAQRCDLCQAVVRAREVERLTGMGGSLWMLSAHDAPCGLPCLGGGVRDLKAYRAGQVHGKRGTPCPVCKTTAEETD